MGYCMSHMGSEFFIAAKDAEAAAEAVRALHGKESIRDCSGRHFSWVRGDFYLEEEDEEVFRAWRWDPVFDDDRNIVEVEFMGEKLGDDIIFFGALAPFVKKGSYIEMSGEDGERWRWIFDGKTVVERTATLSWD